MENQPLQGMVRPLVSISVDDEAQGDKWHATGLEFGGVSIEDAPGIREFEGMKMYLAYLRDPSGNKLCAIKQL